MTPFEDDLKKAMAREEPPEGFAGRVLAAAAPRSAARRGGRFRWVAALAAGLVLTTAGGIEYREYQGRLAKERVLIAVRIAGKEWNKAQRKVATLSGPLSEPQ